MVAITIGFKLGLPPGGGGRNGRKSVYSTCAEPWEPIAITMAASRAVVWERMLARCWSCSLRNSIA